jgi:hypothetical protein
MINLSMPVFYVGEALVGVGWNFSFIAASTIILKGAKPGRELQTIQGVNDSFIQMLMAIIFLISGALYNAIDWRPIAAISLWVSRFARCGFGRADTIDFSTAGASSPRPRSRFC